MDEEVLNVKENTKTLIWCELYAQTGDQAQRLGGSPGHLDNLEQATKDAAIKAGEVSERTFGDLKVFVYGLSAKDRNAALNALGDVFTKSAHGGSEKKALESRKTWFGLGSTKPIDVMLLNGKGGSYTYAGSQGMVLDMSDVGFHFTSARPGGTFTMQRIFAHEIGHAAMGVSDDGPGQMNNVNQNENRIMRELGDTNDRLAY